MVKGPSALFAWLSTYYRDKYSIGIQLTWKAWRLNLKLNGYLIFVYESLNKNLEMKRKGEKSIKNDPSG